MAPLEESQNTRQRGFSHWLQKRACSVRGVVCILLFSTPYMLFGRPAAFSTLQKWVDQQEPGGCILMVHLAVKGTKEDHMSSNRKSKSLTKTRFEEYGMEDRYLDVPYCNYTRIINAAYAKRHGYRFIFSNGIEYLDSLNSKGRSPSWLKIVMLRDKLQCCCKWALMLDSDAYLRMENHALSIEDAARMMRAENYQDLLKTSDKAHPPFSFPQDTAAIVDTSIGNNSTLFALYPRNGWGRYAYGYDGVEGSFEFLNAGVSLWRNTSLALEALDVAWHHSSDYDTKFPWEQAVVNRVLYPKYKEHIAVGPYIEWTGPKGRLIRHLWTSGRDIGDLAKAATSTIFYDQEGLFPQINHLGSSEP